MVPAQLKKVSDTVWELPPSYKAGMLVPARIFATKKLIDAMDEGVFDQTSNVACLPGILKYAFCMPDGHWGYGFPIGGVAAMDPRTGVISPGGIGFDINCGMRLVLTNLTYDEVKPHVHDLVDFVTQESLLAGRFAGEKAQGIHRPADNIRLEAGENVRYCVPHTLSPEREHTIYMRCKKALNL